MRPNGLGILLARPSSTQAWSHQAYLPRTPTGAEASPVERSSRTGQGRRLTERVTRAAAIPCYAVRPCSARAPGRGRCRTNRTDLDRRAAPSRPNAVRRAPAKSGVPADLDHDGGAGNCRHSGSGAEPSGAPLHGSSRRRRSIRGGSSPSGTGARDGLRCCSYEEARSTHVRSRRTT